MTFTSDAQIAAIYTGVMDCTLPKEKWTHHAHWAAAVAMLAEKHKAAFEEMPKIIRAYNTATHGKNSDTEGYHHTITLASLMAAEVSMKTARADRGLFEMTNDILASKLGRPDWLLEYWSHDSCSQLRPDEVGLNLI